MNVICQNKNCNKKWMNIILLELKSTTFSLFLCEEHVSNLEHELLPKWLKTCEKLRKNKFKKEIKMQDSKEIIKNVQSEVEQKQEKINSNIKKWIKRNFQKIALSFAVITGVTGLILGAVAHHKTSELTYYLDRHYEAHWGGVTIWKHIIDPSDLSNIRLYFSTKKVNGDIKWDGIYPKGYFIN